MDRRRFLKATSIGAIAAGVPAIALAADRSFPSKVDPSLFESVNRVKDPEKKTPLEQSHAPVLTCPEKVNAGEPFLVEVSVGEKVHPMGPAHWIEFIELDVGNEPAARLELQPRGFATPKTTFTVVLTKEAAPSGKVTLVAHQRCNLHGYWEGSRDVTVVG